jgi:hydrogenase nickel incorporation protein HypA/HybF
MHEIGIANSILEAVQVEASCHPGVVPRKVAVRIGELAAVDPDALQFSFETLTNDTKLAGLKLEIEVCPRRHRCPGCGTEFRVIDYHSHCPHCGEGRTECISGDELQLAYIEMEEYEPCTD